MEIGYLENFPASEGPCHLSPPKKYGTPSCNLLIGHKSFRRAHNHFTNSAGLASYTVSYSNCSNQSIRPNDLPTIVAVSPKALDIKELIGVCPLGADIGSISEFLETRKFEAIEFVTTFKDSVLVWCPRALQPNIRTGVKTTSRVR
jgi:hypothetical protein